MNKPNIVLITADQMRSDCMGIAGHPVIETPHMDTMAGKGVMFTNAYSATPTCIPARAALLTGLTQKTHGRVGYQDRVPWNYDHYLADELSKAGYHTQCVGKMHVHPSRSLCGFHNVVLHDGYLHSYRGASASTGESQFICDDYMIWLRERRGIHADIIDTGLECNSWVARPWIYEEHLHPTNWVVDQSINFLQRKDPSKPFFLMMSFVRPHSPLDPPGYYFDMYQDKDLPEPLMGDWADTEDRNQDGIVYNTLRGIADKKQLKKARAAYCGCITHIDHQIGRFLQSMFDNNVLKNTVILFTADHGDLLGDHNLFRKSLPYRGSSSIPFFIYDPGNLLGIKNGARLNQIVELRDIMPTLLDIAGAEIPAKIEGRSVLPLLRGVDTPWREYIHGEHTMRDHSTQFIVTEKDKYIWYCTTGREQYFDLENDPDELRDLINDSNKKDRIDCLRKLLIYELDGREEGYSNGNNLIPGIGQVNCLSHIL
jgi:arylsulfatase A-like enzyme